MHTNPVVRFCERKHFSVKNSFRLAIILSLPFIMAVKPPPNMAVAVEQAEVAPVPATAPTFRQRVATVQPRARLLVLARPLVPLAYFSLFTTVAVLSVASNPEKTVCVCWMKARTSLMP